MGSVRRSCSATLNRLVDDMNGWLPPPIQPLQLAVSLCISELAKLGCEGPLRADCGPLEQECGWLQSPLLGPWSCSNQSPVPHISSQRDVKADVAPVLSPMAICICVLFLVTPLGSISGLASQYLGRPRFKLAQPPPNRHNHWDGVSCFLCGASVFAAKTRNASLLVFRRVSALRPAPRLMPCRYQTDQDAGLLSW